MYSSCLAASKFIFTENQFRYLVRSNIFIENALHTQATQFSIRFLSCKHVDNESIPHSFTKETKPNKKIHQIQSNWDHAVEARLSSAVLQSTRCCDRRSAQCDRRIGAQSMVIRLELEVRRWSLFFLSLCDLGSLFSLSLSLSFRKCFEVKIGTENNFRGQSLIFTVEWK